MVLVRPTSPSRTVHEICIGLAHLLFLCSVTQAQAAIYKWTDENGRVHYGDNPPTRDAEEIDVDTAVPADTGLKQRHDTRQRLLESFTLDREEQEAQREKQTAEKIKRRNNCTRFQHELQKIRQASYLKEDTDDPLNPRVLSHAERAQVTGDMERKVQEWCNN